MRYTFGDTITANERLKLMAQFFNPLSEVFISKKLTSGINHAIDLGCGPGYTTQMLAETTKADKVTGMDISENFIYNAQSNCSKAEFIVHDVTKIPFPCEKADLMFCRFLLSHMKNISLLIKNWHKTLNNNGCIYIDELFDISTNNSVFKNYLSINNGLIQSQGANLYVGQLLNNELEEFEIVYNEISQIPVFDWKAASWFYPNTVSIWESEDWVKKKLTTNKRKEISKELYDIYRNKNNVSNITWYMKQIIIINKN